MGLNAMSDWEDYEYTNILGLHHIYPVSDDESHNEIPEHKVKIDIDPINWKDKNAVTRVRDRIHKPSGSEDICASSYATATIEAIEGAYAIHKNELMEFSDQQIIDCSSTNEIMD